MKIVIDIPEYVYKVCQGHEDTVYQYVAKGTQLPKGHGDLIDREKLKKNINGWYAFMKDMCKQPYMTLKQEEIIGKIDMMTPIIEADNKGKRGESNGCKEV